MRHSAVWSSIRYFSWKSVFFRYLFSLFFIILLIFIPYNLAIYKYSDYMLENKISAQASNNALKSKIIFDLLNSNFSANYTLTTKLPNVRNFLEQDSTNLQECNQIQQLLRSIMQSDESIEDVMLYDISTRSYITTRSADIYGEDQAMTWIDTYRATKLPFLMFPRKINSSNFNSIFTIQEIYNKRGIPIGIFCVCSRYDNFEAMVQQSFGENPDEIYIVSDLGLILYSSDHSRINTLMFEDPDIYSAFVSAKESTGNTIFWEDSIISVAKSGHSNLILMSFTNRQKMLGDYPWLNLLMGAGSIVVLLVAVISSLFIALSHYRSVSSIIKTIQNADHPSLLQQTPKLNSEFFYIMRSVADNATEAQKLDHELVHKINQLKHAQLCELQAQINPHFIFNTLQLINLSILRETHADTPATQVISLFSQLLHSTYDTGKVIISVEEEIHNLQMFTDIQSIRYKGRLHAVYDIEEQCLPFCTLKMMLQPFVENCMLHGFQSEKNEWLIHVKCALNEENLVFTICDNGCGIPPQRLEEIRKKLISININGQNIGISNVSQRLILLFDNRSAVEIESTPGYGTCVTIRHPAVMEHPLIDVEHQLDPQTDLGSKF